MFRLRACTSSHSVQDEGELSSWRRRGRHARRAIPLASGEGIHHVAFLVDDVAAELGFLKSSGAPLIDNEPRRGFYGPVTFLHPDAIGGVLIEVVGRPGCGANDP
jgi:catechol 2,3-dioxygenase-like lactoylglutathione lyase family enzyme